MAAADANGKALSVMIRMFENVSKCMADNLALMKEIESSSGGLGLPAVVPAAAGNKGKRKAAGDAPKERKKRKAGTTGYMMYGASIRATIKSEMPELKPPQVMAEIGRRWKALSEAGTSAWNKKAEAKTAELREAEGDPAPPASATQAGKSTAPAAKASAAKGAASSRVASAEPASAADPAADAESEEERKRRKAEKKAKKKEKERRRLEKEEREKQS